MIKINLAVKQSQLNLSNIGGLDFTKIKIKALLIVFVLIYVPDFILYPMWEEEVQVKQQEFDTIRMDLSKIKNEVSKSSEFEKELNELNGQEKKLEEKLVAVKNAISEKRNPASILTYIAKNTPPELWLTDISIEKDTMTIKGDALDYSSLGNFVSSLKSSVFIKEANIVNSTSSKREEIGKTIETFEIRFTIGRFEQ